MQNDSSISVEMAAELAIIRKMHLYSDAANRKDAALFRSLWTAKSLWEIGPPINQSFSGADAITEAFMHLLDSWEFFVQLTSSYHITINGDTATAFVYVNEIARSKTGQSNYNLSQYQDKLILENGEWRFSERRYRVIYLDQTPLEGTAFPLDQVQ
jgi:ketosteroid isomerase-like protein